MWNWVDWSCLSFYSNVWNYYSAVSNTIDVNKWVYYIRDQDGVLLWRVLVTIWKDKKITRYRMYYSWNVWVDLNKYFNEYVTQISDNIWLEMNWSQNEVENIECDEWYKDWEVHI
jgi:hypothetical protein